MRASVPAEDTDDSLGSRSVAPALAWRCCAEERLLTIDPPWAAGLNRWAARLDVAVVYRFKKRCLGRCIDIEDDVVVQRVLVSVEGLVARHRGSVARRATPADIHPRLKASHALSLRMDIRRAAQPTSAQTLPSQSAGCDRSWADRSSSPRRTFGQRRC